MKLISTRMGFIRERSAGPLSRVCKSLALSRFHTSCRHRQGRWRPLALSETQQSPTQSGWTVDMPLRIDKGGETMKIVVIGGTGLIGSKTVDILRQGGHEVVAGSPTTGVNSITGEDLTAAMAGAQMVIDLTNAPSWEDQAVLEFFETSGRNLLAAEAAAGVQHHVAVSIVGTDRMPDNGYFRAKVAQERLIEASGLPYTIIRATRSCMATLRIIHITAKPGTMLPSQPMWEGATPWYRIMFSLSSCCSHSSGSSSSCTSPGPSVRSE